MTLETYGKHRPTPFDSHLTIRTDDDSSREDWLLAPVSQTRDSGCLNRVNFAQMVEALEEIDAGGDDHEVHRFGHWGPGWYEIILVRPGTKAAELAEELAARLEDYPVLDEEALSAAESEEAAESWENWGRSEWRALLGKDFPNADEWPDEAVDALWHNASGACGWSEESSDEGTRFNFRDAIEKVGRDGAAAALREVRKSARTAVTA